MKRRDRSSISIGFAVTVFAAGLLLLASCGPREPSGTDELVELEAWEGYGSQTVVLFFAEGGPVGQWREELRVIELQDDPVDRVDRTLQELFRGPETGPGRAFPPGAKLEHIFLEEREGVLTLDFNPVTLQLLERAGSEAERIALESLRRTLRVNFPAIRKLSILAGGETRETLGGHLNVNRALILVQQES